MVPIDRSHKLNLPILKLRNICKNFGHTIAVRNVSLSLYLGEVVGLVGENGSGKSTLARIISGEMTSDSGTFEYDGTEVTVEHPRDAIARGIRMLPQFPELCPDLSVVENLFLGQEITASFFGIRFLRRTKMRSIGTRLLESVGAPLVPLDSPASHLSGGQKRSLSLAHMLAYDANLLIFDEPTASLGINQQRRMLDLISSQKQNGRAVVLISHHVHEILAACDRVVAMRRGAIVADEPRSQVSQSRLSEFMATV